MASTTTLVLPSDRLGSRALSPAGFTSRRMPGPPRAFGMLASTGSRGAAQKAPANTRPFPCHPQHDETQPTSPMPSLASSPYFTVAVPRLGDKHARRSRAIVPVSSRAGQHVPDSVAASTLRDAANGWRGHAGQPRCDAYQLVTAPSHAWQEFSIEVCTRSGLVIDSYTEQGWPLLLRLIARGGGCAQ